MNESETLDNGPAPVGPVPAPQDATDAADTIGTMRRKRIDEYVVQALRDPDPLRANLAVTSADMMSMSLMLKQAVDQAFSDGAEPLESVRSAMPAIDAYLRLNRQVGRFVDLTERLNAADRHPAAKPR